MGKNNFERKKVLAIVLGVSIVVLYVSSFQFYLSSTNWTRKPVPAAINVNTRLFQALTRVGPYQEVHVDIVNDRKHVLKSDNISFSYSITSFRLEKYKRGLHLLNMKANQKPLKWKGYLKVMQVGEELSKGMKNFLSLAYLLAPGMAQVKLVVPRVRDGGTSLGATGYPFDLFFNYDHLNQVLSNSGYSILVKEEEYDKECTGKTTFVLQHFRPNSRKGGLLTEQVYHELFGKNGSKTWVDCRPNHLTKNADKREFICTREFNVTKLQQTSLRNATCLEVPAWVDHGLSSSVVNMGKDRLNTANIFNWVVKPSPNLINDAKRFEMSNLKRPYVAIHIRSGHINNLPYTVERCFKLALEFVNALKSTRGVNSVFIASDMTKYGSVSARNKEGFEENFASMAGAVTYNPNTTGNIKVVPKASVSLTGMLLLSQSDHLITLGSGSYHGFIVDRFLIHHMSVDPNKWSLIKICGPEARARYH